MDCDSDIEVDIKSEELDEATAGDQSLMCDECPTTLKNEKAIKRHKKDYHEKIICSECGFQYSGRRALYEHVRVHKLETCQTCNKVITRKNMPKHLKICSKPKEPSKQMCERCGYTTKKKGNLQAHQKTHNKVKVATTHSCAYCDYDDGEERQEERREERQEERRGVL